MVSYTGPRYVLQSNDGDGEWGTRNLGLTHAEPEKQLADLRKKLVGWQEAEPHTQFRIWDKLRRREAKW